MEGAGVGGSGEGRTGWAGGVGVGSLPGNGGVGVGSGILDDGGGGNTVGDGDPGERAGGETPPDVAGPSPFEGLGRVTEGDTGGMPTGFFPAESLEPLFPMLAGAAAEFPGGAATERGRPGVEGPVAATPASERVQIAPFPPHFEQLDGGMPRTPSCSVPHCLHLNRDINRPSFLFSSA